MSRQVLRSDALIRYTQHMNPKTVAANRTARLVNEAKRPVYTTQSKESK